MSSCRGAHIDDLVTFKIQINDTFKSLYVNGLLILFRKILSHFFLFLLQLYFRSRITIYN